MLSLFFSVLTEGYGLLCSHQDNFPIPYALSKALQ